MSIHDLNGGIVAANGGILLDVYHNTIRRSLVKFIRIRKIIRRGEI